MNAPWCLLGYGTGLKLRGANMPKNLDFLILSAAGVLLLPYFAQEDSAGRLPETRCAYAGRNTHHLGGTGCWLSDPWNMPDCTSYMTLWGSFPWPWSIKWSTLDTLAPINNIPPHGPNLLPLLGYQCPLPPLNKTSLSLTQSSGWLFPSVIKDHWASTFVPTYNLPLSLSQAWLVLNSPMMPGQSWVQAWHRVTFKVSKGTLINSFSSL